ncbi:MAG: hypothetical protein GY915_04995, partial [bacterium]|nr:hypothetical protein [bacterium]
MAKKKIVKKTPATRKKTPLPVEVLPPVETEVSAYDLLRQEIWTAYKTNPLAWGKYYFPHHFRSASPPFHMSIMKECLNNRYVAIQAPRESAKSTIAAFLYVTHCIAFKKKRHIVILQNTFKKAKETLNTIKNEFKENIPLKKEFRVKISRDAEGDS